MLCGVYSEPALWAVRAGARFAVTYSASYNGTTCTSQSACMAKVVQDNSVGFLAGTKINSMVVNYYISNNLTTPVMTCTAAGVCTATGTPVLPYTYTVATTTGTTSMTINYANQPGNIVEVSIPSYPMLWMVPIKGFSAGSAVTDLSGNTGLGLTLSASAADVLGGLQRERTFLRRHRKRKKIPCESDPNPSPGKRCWSSPS